MSEQLMQQPLSLSFKSLEGAHCYAQLSYTISSLNMIIEGSYRAIVKTLQN